MTKADITEKIYENSGLSKKEYADLLEEVFEIIKESLEKGENIRISGFGNFVVKQKNDRTGRNPQTGETTTITARSVLTDKPSAILKQSLNK